MEALKIRLRLVTLFFLLVLSGAMERLMIIFHLKFQHYLHLNYTSLFQILLLKKIAIIGGGAAGFFAALSAAKNNPSAQVNLYESGKHFLTKVKISGGGRCNVTHNCFDPDSLSSHYPRGARELRAAFYRWQPQDTVDWFTERGVAIKAEADGRIQEERHRQVVAMRSHLY